MPRPQATRRPLLPAQTRSAPGWGQTAFVLLGLLMYMGVHYGLNGTEDVVNTNPDYVYTVSQFGVLLGAAGLMIRYRAQCVAALPGVVPFALLVAFTLFSSLWSQAPDASFRRGVALATMVLFALYAHAALGTARVCRIQLGAMWFAIVASLAMAVAVPSSGFDIGDYSNAVRGVFPQKNSLGDAMTVSMLALGYLVIRRRRLTALDGVNTLAALAITVVSRSTTALVLCMIIIGLTLSVLILARGVAWAGLLLLTGAAGGMALLGVLLLSPDIVFGLLGKDSTLTGRAAIWAAIGHAAGSPTLLGAGYSAFWLPASRATQMIWAELSWQAPSAHSGYLDTLLELGTLGLGLIAGLAALTLVLVAWALSVGRWQEACWAVFVLLINAAFNYDETSLPRPDIHQVQWVLAFLALSGAIAAARRSPAAERR